ncbi:MAG: carbamoyl-phosphate synthase large subunit [Verrucomicrobia bacterium]|nr:carbamoyl-phosphate synthase large subunit [Verrucomicrobiota bacterium]
MKILPIKNLLISNRGEIAIRIARSAADAGMHTHFIFSEDDETSNYKRRADALHRLEGKGPGAYLDIEQILRIARDAGCDAVHPGYGFLSESAAFASSCAQAGLNFVGPAAEVLEIFGDKCKARGLAIQCEVPVLPGTQGATTLDEARQFLAHHGAIMLKAIAGGGGRGMRVVRDIAELEAAYERCRSEALKAFGNGDLYVETLLHRGRHVEVQVIGDGTGDVTHLWERECSLQRSRQKLVEVAPAPGLRLELRRQLLEASLRMARAVKLRSLATFEFLVEDAGFMFIECNPRIQVEHTVTEEVTGVDLVRVQLQLAEGRTLKALGFSGEPLAPRGMAIQLRVNAETLTPDGTVLPATGIVEAFEVPAGPGVRVDTCGHGGFRVNPRFDSLLAKVIVHVPGEELETLVSKARRVVSEFRIEGVASNLSFLERLLSFEPVVQGQWYTNLIEDNLAALCAPVSASGGGDPLAILSQGKRSLEPALKPPLAIPDGMHAITAAISGTVVSIDVGVGDTILRGQPVAVLEAMKMETVVPSSVMGIVREVRVAANEILAEGAVLLVVEEAVGQTNVAVEVDEVDPSHVRPDLAEVQQRRTLTLDSARPEVVQKRHGLGLRMARENIEHLCDAGSFHEYGGFTVAAQRTRRTMGDLIARTPADGLVMGIGRVNGGLFPDTDARCIAMSYDYTVLAGTQGAKNHKKKDRMFELAAEWRLPVVVFAEGGGGRPGDTDEIVAGWLDIRAFTLLAKLSGLVPLVGVVSGRCFAGNAVVAGCCDVIIATEKTSLGMGGPAMIEGGGLGVFHPDEVGPTSVQRRNGVIDIVVADEAEAVSVAKKYLSYFQGPVAAWECADQRELRHVIPENRLRVYDVRKVIEFVADRDSVLELRRDFGANMITAFIRIEGRPMGLIANNPMLLGGAIDADAADKAARFLQLCDAFDIPVLSLCDTPGNMVGPEAERTALVRHCCRLYVTGANMTVPIFSVVLRKAYGLGSQGMVGGSFHLPMFSVAWPTGEFGPMNLEGSVKLGFRKELEAVTDTAERKTLFDRMVADAYERGKALHTATLFEIDDVIDPADTRSWIMAGLRSMPPPKPRTEKKRPFVDTW